MGMKYKIKELVNVLNAKISRITFVSYEQLISGYYMCNLEKKLATFYGYGSTAWRLEPFRGGTLLFTTKSPEIPGTHFLNTGAIDWESSALTTRSMTLAASNKSSLCNFRISAFFISNIFISNSRLKLAKNWAKAKQHLEAELLLIENYFLSSSTLSSRHKYTKYKNVSV